MHYLVVAILCSALGLHATQAHAQIINEVFFSPTSKQWIEIYNNTSSDIDLTQYKILDNGASVNGHGISMVSGSGILPTGAYGVIAKDPTLVSSQYVFKSSLGIKATGDSISLKNGSTVISTLSFPDGSSSNGNSYQNTDTGWIFSTPTPGIINTAGSISLGQNPLGGASTSTENTSETQVIISTPLSSHYNFVPLSTSPIAKFVVSAGRDRLGYVGVPLTFKAVVNTDDPNASYVWTFGDGSRLEGRDINHTYLYPGVYTVVLNAELFDNKAVSRITVKIIIPELEIIEANHEFISVRNNSKYEVNFYGWKLTYERKVFEFPQDTIIPPGEITYFPQSVTQLSPAQRAWVVLSKVTEATIPIQAEVVSIDQAKQKMIEELTLKLAHAQKMLADIRSEESAITGTFQSQTHTASVIESIDKVPSPETDSWFTALKHFFKFK